MGSSKQPSFTEKERQYLALLPVNGSKVTSSDLVAHIYGAKPPLHAREIVISRMRGIMRKAEIMKPGFVVCKSKRAGPNPIEFWRQQAA